MSKKLNSGRSLTCPSASPAFPECHPCRGKQSDGPAFFALVRVGNPNRAPSFAPVRGLVRLPSHVGRRMLVAGAATRDARAPRGRRWRVVLLRADRSAVVLSSSGLSKGRHLDPPPPRWTAISALQLGSVAGREAASPRRPTLPVGSVRRDLLPSACSIAGCDGESPAARSSNRRFLRAGSAGARARPRPGSWRHRRSAAKRTVLRRPERSPGR